MPFKLSADDAKKNDTMLAKFDEHFVLKKNTVFVICNFNRHKQEDENSAEAFIIETSEKN